MTEASSFPLSLTNRKRVTVLLACYALAVVLSEILYIRVTGDRRFPVNFVFVFTLTALSAFGVWARHRWAWALTIIFAAWQIYVGITHAVVTINAGIQGPLAVKLMAGAASLRTLLMVVIFVLLLFSSDR